PAAKRSSGSSAFSATSSGIQVFPSWHRSGVESPANAVSNFSWAAVQGSCCSFTRMVGWSRSKSRSSSATTSLSRPMAQKRTTVSRADGESDGESQPGVSASVAARPRSAARNSAVRELLTGAGEPPTREAGFLEATTQIRVLAHHAPDQGATIVLHHRQDHALVDAEVVTGDPAELGDALAVSERNVVGERSIERVEKAVLRVDVLAEAAVHLQRGRDDQLRREGHGRYHRRRRQRAVVVPARGVDAARHVAAEPMAPSRILDFDVGRPVA